MSRFWERDSGDEFACRLVEAFQLIEICDVKDRPHQGHPFRGMQQHVRRTALDELEVNDLSLGIQLCDEAVVVSCFRLAIDVRDEVFLSGRVADEAIG